MKYSVNVTNRVTDRLPLKSFLSITIKQLTVYDQIHDYRLFFLFCLFQKWRYIEYKIIFCLIGNFFVYVHIILQSMRLFSISLTFFFSTLLSIQ